MKLTTIKAVALAAAITAISAVPVFAEKGSKEGMKHHGPMMFPPAVSFNEPVVLGTVTSIDTDSSMIVITDIDGKNKKIHVNPLTKLARIDEKTIRRNMEAKEKKDKKYKSRSTGFDSINIEYLQKGHWVSVSKFNTGTDVIEAKTIHVHNDREIQRFDTSNAK